jgi:hypothetical protein
MLRCYVLLVGDAPAYATFSTLPEEAERMTASVAEAQ